jgi:glycerol uptake facilitator protein
MTPFHGKILGTALLILFGDGTVANVILAKSKAQNAGWIVVVTGWAMGVFDGAFTVASISGAHLNPAVSLGLAITGKFPWAQVPVYVAVGGFC